jgi:hypothetical protein
MSKVLEFNQQGIDKIKDILKNNNKLFVFFYKQIDPTIIQDIYKLRITKTSSSISFKEDISASQDTTLLIEDNDIIYSVFVHQEIEKDKQYTSIKIEFLNKQIYNLRIDKIIGVVKSNDIPEQKYWSDVAQEIYNVIIPSEHISSTKSATIASTASRTRAASTASRTRAASTASVAIATQNIPYFKINQDGVNYIHSSMKLIRDEYERNNQNKKGHETPDNPVFMQNIQSRVNKSSLATDGVIQFTQNVKSNFEMFVLRQNGVVFSILNNGKKLGTKYNMNYEKDKAYTVINIFIHSKQYLIDLNDIIGVVNLSDKPEIDFWYNLATYLSSTIPDNSIDTSFQPSYLVAKATSPIQRSPAAKATSPIQRSPAAKATSPKISHLPVAARTAEKKLKKILKPSEYNRYINDLSELKTPQQCNQIIDELQKIDDLSVSTRPKALIRNPKNIINPNHRPATIAFDSDIVLSALYKCYHDPNLGVKDVLDVIDLDVLQQDKPKSRATQQNENIRLNDIMASSKIEEYRVSCNYLKTKTEIEYDEYVLHMQKLFRILQAIYDYFHKGSRKEHKITIYLFDERTINNYQKHIENLSIGEMTKISRGVIFHDERPVKSIDNVLKNTFLNRAIHLKFFQNTTIVFNHEYSHHSVDDDFEYHRYTSILPKFHCLNSTAELSKKYSKDINNMLLELNNFTKDFPEEYIIKGLNNPSYENIFRNISSYSDDKAVNKLLCVLINNNYNKKQSIKDYYYYFLYDGPAPAISLMNAVDYVKSLNTYQPLNIFDNDLSDIEAFYKGTSPLFSRVVNEGLQNHILHGVKLQENTTRKLEVVLKYAQFSHKPNYNKNDIYVFHGTQNMMHAKDEREINLISFLSCSFNIYISIDYALNNLIGSTNTYKKGIVYIFRIEKHQNYINFNDGLFQIILLPGTKIIIHNEINVGRIKYVLCHIDDTDVLNYGKQLLKDIKEGTELLKTYTITRYVISDVDVAKYPYVFQMPFPTDPNDRRKFRNHVENIFVIKHQNTDYIYTSLGKLANNYNMHSFHNIQYTLHQHFINDCYHYFDVNCAKYILGYDRDNIYTAWKVDTDYVPSHHDFKYNIKNLLIDCLLGNIDCQNSTNYLVLNSNKNINRLISLKGCGMFNTAGYRNPRFNKNQEPYEYLGIFCEVMLTIPNIQNMQKEELGRLLDYDNFLLKLVSFGSFLEQNYQLYLHFLIDNLKIPEVSQEMNDLQRMIGDLKDILKMRANYFSKYKDGILHNIIEYMKEDRSITSVATGGKFSLRNGNNTADILPYNFVNYRLNEKIQKTHSNSRKNPYEMIKNIPIPTDTKYKLKHLAEPYKSYYLKLIKKSENVNSRKYRSFEASRKKMKLSSRKYKSLQDESSKYDNYIVDTFNEGYCVSNKTFQDIKNRLSKK